VPAHRSGRHSVSYHMTGGGVVRLLSFAVDRDCVLIFLSIFLLASPLHCPSLAIRSKRASGPPLAAKTKPSSLRFASLISSNFSLLPPQPSVHITRLTFRITASTNQFISTPTSEKRSPDPAQHPLPPPASSRQPPPPTQPRSKEPQEQNPTA
jgi:hypothetical protein